jgi:hypothetical protein
VRRAVVNAAAEVAARAVGSGRGYCSWLSRYHPSLSTVGSDVSIVPCVLFNFKFERLNSKIYCFYG